MQVVLSFGIIPMQWMLQMPKATTFVGGIGKDEFGARMIKLAANEGVNVSFWCAYIL